MDRKRKRLSYACNYCRLKKTRCDEQQPSCRNCRTAGVECVTTDKRRAGVVVAHHRRTAAVTSPPAAQTPDSHPSPAVASTPGVSSHDRTRAWSQCWDKTGWQTGRLPMMPRFVGASMFELTTEWLDLAFYRLKVAPCHGISSRVRVSVSADDAGEAPTGVSLEESERYVALYLEGLHRLFPFLSQERVQSIYRTAETSQQLDAPSQALQYLVTVVGLMSSAPTDRSEALVSAYLRHCNSLLGHLVASRNLQSVQAILLFAIVLRSCDQIAWAWDILSLGVSMAQSVGINQRSRTGEDVDGQGYHTWWCLYVVEKILAFESGRPSMIWDRELSSLRSDRAGSQNTSDTYQTACVGLANILHEIQERSARAWRREEWLPQTVDEAIEEKIHTGGELGMLLAEWQQSLPPEYQSKSSVATDFHHAPQAAFLSFYYYQATILLNRSTLLIEKAELHDVVQRYGSGKPWQYRVSNGGALCVEAARDMIKLLVSLVDSRIPTYLTTMASPLAAVYVLAMHVLRERSSLLIRSDFELMKAGMELTRQHYQKHDISNRVGDVLLSLEQYIEGCLNGRLEDMSSSSAALNVRLTPTQSPENAAMPPLDLPWGPSALDLVGWDWNDLSHLFEHGE